jgi:hypothetical protein
MSSGKGAFQMGKILWVWTCASRSKILSFSSDHSSILLPQHVLFADSKPKKIPSRVVHSEPETSDAPWSAVNDVLDGLASGDPTTITKPAAAVRSPVARSTSPRVPLKKKATPPPIGFTESSVEPSLVSSFRRTKSRAPVPTDVSLGFAPLSTLEDPASTMQPRPPASKPSLKMKRAFAPATKAGLTHVGEDANKGRYGKQRRTVAATQPGAFPASEPDDVGRPAERVHSPAVASSTGHSNVKLRRTAAATKPGAAFVASVPGGDRAAAAPVKHAASPTGQRNAKIKGAAPALFPSVVSEASGATAEASRAPSEPNPREPRPASRKPSSGLVKLRHAAPAIVPRAIAGVEEPQEPDGRSMAPLSRDEADELLKTRRRNARADGLVPGVREVGGEEVEHSSEVIRRKDPTAAAQALSKTKDDRNLSIDPNECEENRQRRLDEMERMEVERSARLHEEAAAASLTTAAAAMSADAAAAVTTADRGQIKEPPLQYGQTDWEHPGGGGVDRPDDGELAVAQAVEDDDDENDPFLAFAEEYNPDAKPPLYRNRRFRLYAMLALTTVIAIIVGAIVGVTVNEGDILPPTMAPTTEEELNFRLQFSAVSEEVFRDGTPYDLAANWIMFEDPMNLSPDAPNLIQRYVLTLFYYMTTNNRQTKWLSCNPPEPEENENCTFLVLQPRFDEYDDEAQYVEEDGWSRWLSSANECDWAGVYCDHSSTVRELEILGHNMTGTLPSELASLPYLQSISLQNNEFTGTLPWDVFGKMRLLVVIEMHFNRLTGSIPEFFWEEMTALQNLNFGGNKLTGTISTLLGRMTELFELRLFENDFVGSIPSEIGNLRSLGKCTLLAVTAHLWAKSSHCLLAYCSILASSIEPVYRGDPDRNRQSFKSRRAVLVQQSNYDGDHPE